MKEKKRKKKGEKYLIAVISVSPDRHFYPQLQLKILGREKHHSHHNLTEVSEGSYDPPAHTSTCFATTNIGTVINVTMFDLDYSSAKLQNLALCFTKNREEIVVYHANLQ